MCVRERGASGPSSPRPTLSPVSPALLPALWSHERFCLLLQVSVTCTPFTEGAADTGLGRRSPHEAVGLPGSSGHTDPSNLQRLLRGRLPTPWTSQACLQAPAPDCPFRLPCPDTQSPSPWQAEVTCPSHPWPSTDGPCSLAIFGEGTLLGLLVMGSKVRAAVPGSGPRLS